MPRPHDHLRLPVPPSQHVQHPAARCRFGLSAIGLALALLSSACIESGEPGALNRGRFSYQCLDSTDTGCDRNSGQLPAAIAVGSRFRVTFAPESGPLCNVVSPVTSLLESTAEGFFVRAPGSFALVATNVRGEAVDFIQQAASEIRELRFRRDSDVVLARLTLSVGDTAIINAEPFDARGTRLAGALPYTWQVSGTGALTLEPSTIANRMRVVARSVGALSLVASVGDHGFTLPVDIVAGTAPPLPSLDGGSELDGGLGTDASLQTDAGAP